MKRTWKWGAVIAAVLASPVGASGAQATCASSYLLCINEATQGDGASTWKEMQCGWEYVGCLRRQATEA